MSLATPESTISRASRLPRHPGRSHIPALAARAALLGVSLVSAVLVPGFAADPPGGSPLAGPIAQVAHQGADGLVLRIRIPAPQTAPVTLPDGKTYWTVTLPGFDASGGAAEGAPDLPSHGFPFGVPEGATARIGKVRVLDSAALSGFPPVPAPTKRMLPGDPFPTQEYRYQPDPGSYAATSWVPAANVELSAVRGLRHQRVQSLVLWPVRAIPATGAYEAIREIEVEIRFDLDRAQPQGARVPVTRDAPGWDQTYDRLLLNAESARTFRSRPAPAGAAVDIVPGAAYVRIRIGGTGMARVPYADLAAAGWPSGTPVAQVRLEERGYDKRLADPFTEVNLPRIVEDTNGNGTFDPGDFVVFYAMNFQDRFHPLISDSRYSYFHTYWLTDAAPGAAYPVVDGYPAGTGFALADSFPYTHVYEQNLIYTNNPGDSGSLIFPIYDTHYWLDSDDLDVPTTFAVVDLAPGATYRVRARWQGKDTVASTFTHIVSLVLNGQVILPETSFQQRFPFLWEGTAELAAGVLSEGANTMTIKAHTVDPTVERSGAYFDWYEVTYARRFVARGDQLAFNTGALSGKREFAVSGFSSSDLVVLDVTDPVAPVRLTPQVVDAGGTWTARIRLDLAGAPRQLLAVVPASLNGLPPTTHPLPPDLGTAAIAPGLPRDLLTAGEGSDYILITHPTLENDWSPLVDHRESLGHQVFVCDVWEIYDQFAGGDKTPWAIQRFLSDAFQRWDPSPSFVLLGGDASEDYRTELDTSDPDWVPTMMHFGSVTGTAGLELAGTDSWYGAFLRPGDSQDDVAPDIHVARIPTGTAAETQAFVQKILQYETEQPGDTWRERGFFFADDQYSSGLLEAFRYCFQPGELPFRTTTQAMCDSIRVRGGLSRFRCQTYFLADRLDTVDVLQRTPGPGDCPIDPITREPLLLGTRTYTRTNVTPAAVDSLSQGWLIWEFTGHGNKNLMTHEQIWVNYPSLSLSSRDMDRVNNFGKPFLFMGYACHLVEFEGYREKTVGQSIGEVLLFAPNRGAIGVWASTSYEWLHTNPMAQKYTTRPLFWNLPRDPATGRPRRLFGEAMTRGMTALLFENPAGFDPGMLRTYQTFGDPALQVDVWSSLFAGVEVNDVPWVEGTALTAPSFTDSVSVDAVISDDVDVSSIKVLDGGVELPASRVHIVSPPSTQEGAQTYQVNFKTVLHLGTYEVAVVATDWAGRESRLVFPVTFGTEFWADGRILGNDDTIDPNAVIEARFTTPVPLQASAFAVFVDGTPYSGEIVPVLTGGVWTLTIPGPWAAGSHTLEVRIQDPNATCVPAPCPLVQSVTFEAGEITDRLSMTSVPLFYPNPLEGEDGVLVFELNRNAARGQITIYTVGGRRVLRTEIAPVAGLNSFRWDLRDAAGDRVANGVYLAVMELIGYGGERITTGSEPIRIAVTR